MKSLNKCSFCSEFHSDPVGDLFFKIVKDFSDDTSRILHETEHWVVVPTIGSIIPGYLLVVSKVHYTSVSAMPDSTYFELNEIIKNIKSLFGILYKQKTLVFEHGAISSTNKGPCCVDHAHVHVVPFSDIVIYPTLEKELGPFYYPNSFLEIKKKVNETNLPYLFFQDTDGAQYLTFGESIPSQYLRKFIASYTVYPDRWNWLEYPFLDNIFDTINTFKNRI